MSLREIALHLALLMLLLLAGAGFHAYQRSAAIVPAMIRSLDSESLRERQAATSRLKALGTRARSAAPRLLQFTAETRSRDAAAASVALRHIDLGSARIAMERARAALAATDLDTRRRGAEILGDLGLFARSAVPELIAACRDPDPTVRDRAVSALGRIGSPTGTIVPTLLAALDDPADHVRHAALTALDELPAELTAAARPGLLRLASDPDSGLLQRARFSLQKMDSAQPLRLRIDVLRHSLDTDAGGNAERQWYALQKLALLAPLAVRVEPESAVQLAGQLAQGLPHVDDLARLASVEILGSLGPAGRSATPALRSVLNDPEPILRESAREALQAIGAPP